MDLFEQLDGALHNLLPYDGEVHYHDIIISQKEANNFYESLLNEIAWQNDEAIIFGEKIITKRKVAWYADAPFAYTYSKTTKIALPWTPLLQTLKDIIERESGEIFNACLLNLYHNGSEGMAWHSDAEKDLKKNGAIGSLSFGAARKFAFKHKQTNEKVSIILSHGSFLVMKGVTQSHWLHRLPLTKTVDKPRINLTFRMIDESDSKLISSTT